MSRYLSIGNSHQVSREWQERGRLTRSTKSRNGGGEVRPVGLVILAATLMGVIVAHFFFPPSPGQTPRCTADTPTPPFYTTHDQDTGKSLRTPTDNTLSLLSHLALPPRDGSAGRGRTESAATGRLCRFVLFFLFLSFFVSLFLTLSARPTPVSFKVTSHAIKPRGKRRKQGPFLLESAFQFSLSTTSSPAAQLWSTYAVPTQRPVLRQIQLNLIPWSVCRRRLGARPQAQCGGGEWRSSLERLHAIFSASLTPPLLLGRLVDAAVKDLCLKDGPSLSGFRALRCALYRSHALMLHVRLQLTACPRLFDVGVGLLLEWGKCISVLIPA